MLKQALRQNPKRQQVAVGASIPAPVGGWDASSPLAVMKPENAVRLDNWEPEPGYVRIRRGSTKHAASVGSASVNSLMAYHGITTATDALFAASSTTIYNVTTAFETDSAVTSLSNGKWQHVNVATSGGNFLVICNGADAPRTFDGSVWATPAIAGEDETTFVHVTVHKKRIWFVEVNTTKAAYMTAVDTIAGTTSPFNLGSVFTMGGYLQAIGNWTIDAGEGVDDHLVFFSSKGQAAIYTGIDPATDFALVGVFNLGSPLGRRCLTKVAGDLAVISIDGVLPLSRAIALDRGAVQNVAITAKIQNAMNTAARRYGDNYGWQLIGYPKGTKAILNVPITEGSESHQYVMNTLTGAWCRFTGMDANCWEVFQDRLFFGGNGGDVYEADVGAIDFVSPITCDMITAFNYFGSHGRRKRWTSVQPLITSDGIITPSLEINTDFQVTDNVTATVSSFETIGSNWDEVNWGAFTWAEDTKNITDWNSVDGEGQCAAVHMALSVSVNASLLSYFDEAKFDVNTFDTDGSNAVTLQVSGFNLTMERGGFM